MAACADLTLPFPAKSVANLRSMSSSGICFEPSRHCSHARVTHAKARECSGGDLGGEALGLSLVREAACPVRDG